MKRGITIRTALNGTEKQLRLEGKLLSVDGYDEESGKVYEVLGCAVHSCQNRYLCTTARKNYAEQLSPFNKDLTHREVYTRSVDRAYHIFKRVLKVCKLVSVSVEKSM